MRIGTWNLEGRCKPDHLHLLSSHGVDVWLLTEVPNDLALPEWQIVRSEPMDATKSFAAVVGRELRPLDAPHPATASAEKGGIVFVSTVLPWRSAKGAPWEGDSQAARTLAAIRRITAHAQGRAEQVVWGGDWNHALYGSESAGCREGRQGLREAVGALGMRAITEHLAHRNGTGTIDHIAVPSTWGVHSVERISVANTLSDHDAYVVHVEEAPSGSCDG